MKSLLTASAAIALIGMQLSPLAAKASTNQAAAPQGSKPIKVAAVDFIPAWGDLSGNIRRLVSAAEAVAAQGINYAVFPETALSGYAFADPSQLAPSVDTIPGKATSALLPLLKRTGL